MFSTEKEPGSRVVDIKSLLLVAGNGALPMMLAQSLRRHGVTLNVCGLQSEVDVELKAYATAYSEIKVGQLAKMLKFIKSVGPDAVIFLGGVSKKNLLKNFRPDLLATKLIASIRSVEDDKLLRAVAGLVEKEGFPVLSIAELMPELLVARGLITKRNLTSQEESDSKLGMSVAKKIGELEIGQSVLVYNGVVLAVEAVEGTDACIKRAGEIVGGNSNSGIVLVKTSKPQQDLRLDLPTVGLKTLEVCKASAVSAIVLEAGKCLMESPEEFKRQADCLGIAVLGV